MLQTIFNILKITAVILIAAVFMIAINTLLGLIGTLIFHSVIGEVFGLASMFLPFNAASVFGAFTTATVAILAFLIAKKIFDLTSWGISAV